MKLDRRPMVLAALAAIPLALTILTGCTATANGASPDATSSPAPTYEDAESYQLAFEQCLTDAGVDLPTRTTNEDGFTIITDPDDPRYPEAAEDCTTKLGGSPLQMTDAEIKEAEEARLAFYQCLRDNGYDAKTPTDPIRGGGQSSAEVDAGQVDPYGGAPEDVISTCSSESGY